MFHPKIAKIIYCYSEYSPAFDNMENVTFSHGFTEDLIARENLGTNNEQTMLILDDLSDEIAPSTLGKLFTKLSHHRRISIFFLVQNLYFRALPNMRLLNLNSHVTGEYANELIKICKDQLVKMLKFFYFSFCSHF